MYLGLEDAMPQTVRTGRASEGIQVKIGCAEDCWKTLAALIAKRAAAIYNRRVGTQEEGTEIWQLAQAQIERPLSCGILKLTRGLLISFNSADLGTPEIEVCVEPRRLVLLGRNSCMGGSGAKDAAVRVLKLPNEVDPSRVTLTREGPIIDIELHDAARSSVATAKAVRSAGAAA
jgi:hypothetical protein